MRYARDVCEQAMDGHSPLLTRARKWLRSRPASPSSQHDESDSEAGDGDHASSSDDSQPDTDEDGDVDVRTATTVLMAGYRAGDTLMAAVVARIADMPDLERVDLSSNRMSQPVLQEAVTALRTRTKLASVQLSHNVMSLQSTCARDRGAQVNPGCPPLTPCSTYDTAQLLRRCLRAWKPHVRC